MNAGELRVCWISAGVSSFVAGYLERETVDHFIYIDIADQHPDSMRFIRDCERALNRPIEILKAGYEDVADVIRKENCIKIPGGFAPCTNRLKKQVRKAWEKAHEDFLITYVWGMDANESNRAERLDLAMMGFNNDFPLIERGLTKQDAHAICERLGIKRPAMYELGYSNNNCIGCIKGGMGYWNKIRVDFPEVFPKPRQARARDRARDSKERRRRPAILRRARPGQGQSKRRDSARMLHILPTGIRRGRRQAMSAKEKQIYQALREAFGASNVEPQEKIVHCMDCKFSRVIESTRFPARFIGRRYCILWGDGIQGEWVPDRGFCHKGKSKEESNG